MKKSIRSSTSSEFTFPHLAEFKIRREDRLGLVSGLFIDERPEKYYTEEEWCQFLDDYFTTLWLIDNFKPIPEELEHRVLKGTKKLKEYIRSGGD